MSDPISSNDPLGPVYQQNPGKIRPEKSLRNLTSKSNLVVLVVIAAVLLALFAMLGGGGKEEPAAPAATEIR
ncbi:MAG: hypothetical protein IPI81_06875 [Flavobacteriales bacterium]|nr:hypothetical protein [Flavobacteriales bacterium]MCC6938720.1 hypothetical protein [Flavobacteriales bacterium]